MTDITDAQIVNWANTRARTLCDQVTRLYYELLAYQSDYVAAGIAAKVTAAGATNPIADGSDVDGRTRITGTTLINLKATVDQLKTQFETAVSGVGATVAAVSNGIQVNGSPR